MATAWSPTSSQGGTGGGSGTVTNVSSANTSVAVANPTTTPVLTVATLDVLATNGPPAAAVALNAKKITGLASGSAAQDAAAFGQIPTTLPASNSLDAIAAAHATAGDISMSSHKVTNVTDPSSAQDAATKNYVDAVALGLTFKSPADLGTIAVLPSNVYVNGASGVGATLTASAFGALSVDGTAVTVGQRVLVKNEAAASHNGIYTVTATGGGAALYVLTRATDYNQTSEIQAGDAVFVTAGGTLADTLWIMTTTGTITVGTTAIVFSQLGASGVTSVTATDASVVVAGTGTAPTIATGTLDAIATAHPPVAAVAFNGQKGTGVANGSAASDIAAFGQLATAGPITSVFARTGAVVAAAGDYLASQVTNAADKIATSIQSFAAGIVSTHATQGIGYATGAGGTVTQATSRSTGVTINKVSGDITLFTTTGGTGAYSTFTVTNSAVAATDTPVVVQKSGTDQYTIFPTNVTAGSFKLTIATTGGNTNEAPVLHFNIMKGVAA